MCEKKDSIIILACHGVYDPDLNTMYAEHTEDEEIFKAVNDWIDLDCKWLDLDFRFFPVSNLPEDTLKYVLPKEQEYIDDLKHGINAYYNNPNTQQLIKKRDPFETRKLAKNRYINYNLPTNSSGKLSTKKSSAMHYNNEVND